MNDLKKIHLNYKNRIRLMIGVGLPYIPMGGRGFMFQLFTFYKCYQRAGLEFFSMLVFKLEWSGQLAKTLEIEAKWDAREKAQKDLLTEARKLTAPK